MTAGRCWIDGEVMPLDEARIPVRDHGLLYGDGVFEGIRFHGRRPFLLDAHLQRLFDSARAIALDCPWPQRDIEAIVQQTIDACDFDSGYLRLLLTRGDGALGIDPRSCPRPRLIVIADQLRMVDERVRREGARLIVASTRRLPPDGLDPRIKSLNYLNHILARIEANRAGADEAVLLNAQGRVAEGTVDNLFIVKGGRLLTPPVIDGALAGITRGLLLELAREQGIETREQSLSAYDLHCADECFLCGTGAELIPVHSIDGRNMSLCPGEVFLRLQDAFLRFVERASQARG
jgi:branched-chain amino acid aminotransferase